MIPGWDDFPEFQADGDYNTRHQERLYVVESILGGIQPPNEEERALLQSIKDAVNRYAVMLRGQEEIYAGCWGADIWSENPITQKQKLVKSESSWADIEDTIRELHRKDPSMLYWTRPHDPRKKTGIVAWLKSIFKHNNLDS